MTQDVAGLSMSLLQLLQSRQGANGNGVQHLPLQGTPLTFGSSVGYKNAAMPQTGQQSDLPWGNTMQGTQNGYMAGMGSSERLQSFQMPSTSFGLGHDIANTRNQASQNNERGGPASSPPTAGLGERTWNASPQKADAGALWGGSLWSGSNIWSTGPNSQGEGATGSPSKAFPQGASVPSGEVNAAFNQLVLSNGHVSAASVQQGGYGTVVNGHTDGSLSLAEQLVSTGLVGSFQGPLPTARPQPNGLSNGLHHSPLINGPMSQHLYRGLHPGQNGVPNRLTNDLGAHQGLGLQTAGFGSMTAQMLLQQQLQPLQPRLQQPSLEEKLLLLQQAGNNLGALPASAVRQQPPPPPPPRSQRPQLPPPLISQPPPPPRTGAPQALKKPAPPPPLQRASGNERFMPGAKPRMDMGELNEALEELVESLRPLEEELEQQQRAFAKVTQLLKMRWPEAQVHQFGSTANSLSICYNNDIDVCLEIEEPENDPGFKSDIVEAMGELMTEAGMKVVLPLPKARVPVVKFVVPETGTKVDVTVNNILAIVNTKLLGDYGACDERLLKLSFVVKHWAKRRQVNDSYRGTLSSYCYVLMCIHHLQTRSPPILPCLQAIQPATHTRMVGPWKCDYHDCVEQLSGFGAANKETLAELTWSFFENWAWKHDYNNSVISVRTASLLTKAQKDWTRRIGNERHLVCIEDPFEVTHDLGRTVDRQTSGVLHKEFERAANLLRDVPNPLAQLFQPYRAGKPE